MWCEEAMGDLAIRVENLSKRYRIGQRERYLALRDVLARAISAPFRVFSSNSKPDSRNPRSDYIWALKDVSFEVKQGEVVGIIGRNGAGKTTLLKILARITRPTSGYAEVRGRVGSLLEVGTGFHPELTGRENIYLSGAILGMKKAEIDRKFDEIVAFAEIEKFIDTPVKYYSSGMYVRLAFAVAAHLEPDILLVDEVLAVGDAAFQKKCLGKMGDVAKEGRTVLFVSHNMGALNQLCPRSVVLASGRLVEDGETRVVLGNYLRVNSGKSGEYNWPDPALAPGNQLIRLSAVRLVSNGRITSSVNIDESFSVEVDFWILKEGLQNVCVNIYLLDGIGRTVISTADTPAASFLSGECFYKPHSTGLYRSTCTFPGNLLNEGLYHVSIYVVTLGPLNVEAQAEYVLSFEVIDTGVMREPGAGQFWDGVIRIRLPWHRSFVKSLDGGLFRSPSIYQICDSGSDMSWDTDDRQRGSG
jgi:lipopolysaccharide transport system ATP-binding protein